jgi:dolichol-phosphate mannosyltransferase
MQALEAGLKNSSGNFVLTMDSDLQMPASYIPVFWRARQKHAIIAGQQVRRKDKKIKSVFSQNFYLFLQKNSSYKITLNGGDFRLYPRQFVEEILKINSNFKVFRFLAPKLRFPIVPLRFIPAERHGGKSSYSIRKMTNLAKNSLLSLSIAPMKLIAIYFSVFFLFFIGICIYAFYSFMTRELIPGWTSVSMSISLGFLGVLGCLYIVIEYLIKIYENSQALPSYIIQQINNFE